MYYHNHMNTEFENRMKELYPNFFRIACTRPAEGEYWQPIQLGFEVAKGWQPIVEEAAQKIEALNTDVACVQVKEKFGGLRIYTDYIIDEVVEIIREAEKKAECTCEFCGAPGTLRQVRWWKTLCDSCNENRYKKD